ncbi:MAG: AAA family ATPase [Parcubacteria group bacterium]|nr:AAA family ATPase [Parcubacteria group bacterium]
MSDTIGHEKIVEFLDKSHKNNRLVHAYLFVGPEHIGKNTVAIEFAHKIFGNEPKNHPDFTLVERERDQKTDKLKKNISIEQVRKLNARLGLSSFLNSYKVALIPEAEALNSASANSLLKTLEEPKGKTVIILCAESAENLLPTIVSRCQVLNFSPIKKEKIHQALLKKGVSENQAKNFSHLSFGRPGIALNFLEDENAFEFHQSEVEKCCELVKSSISDRFINIEDYFSRKMSLQDRVGQLNKILWIWSSLFRDVLYIKEGSAENLSNYFAKNQMEELVSRFSNLQILNILKSIEKTRRYLSINVSPRLALENLVLNF